MNDEKIKEICLEHGFAIKPGESDLKPYVYAAAHEIAAAAEDACKESIAGQLEDFVAQVEAGAKSKHAINQMRADIAAKCLQGMWANSHRELIKAAFEEMAHNAVLSADALIAALGVEPALWRASNAE